MGCAGGFSSLNNNSVTDIIDQHGNERCADCGELGAEWASVSFGICVCTKYGHIVMCAYVHARLFFWRKADGVFVCTGAREGTEGWAHTSRVSAHSY